jgi:PiT family inorganic phosphate transporter
VDIALLLTAGVFCVVAGINDGAALSATSARVGLSAVIVNVAILSLALVLVPLVDQGVAMTLAARLGGGGDLQPVYVLVAVGSSVLVVGWLSQSGQPTSLTLALIGALTGAALGAGARIDGWLVVRVLVIAAIAPFVAGGVAAVLTRGAAMTIVPGRRRTVIAWGRRLGLVVQGVAYAANDGQKLLAVASLAAPAMVELADPTVGTLATLAGLFVLGTVAGLRGVSRTLTDRLLPVRPVSGVVATYAASSAVLASAAVGAPISMTQAVAGGLVGSGTIAKYRSIRWRAALKLVQAWLVTLPVAFGLAALVAALV